MRIPDKQTLDQRRLIYSIAVIIFFGFLLSGFIRLQLNKKDIYVQRSISNSIRKIDIYPVRGLIRDRHGDILVDNRPSFATAVIPKVVSDSTITQLASMFNIPIETIRKKIRKEYGFRPIIIARDIPQEQLIRLEENKLDFPGVVTLVESKRYYAEDIRSPHIFGTIGEVTLAEQLLNPDFKTGDLTGKSGLEKEYNSELRGDKGVKFLRVDASGKEIGLYDTNRDEPPVHGSDLYLFMDYKLQQFAEELFNEKRGALVAIDVHNGGIIALASKPDYNPSLLAGKIDAEIWEQLLSDESHPLYSRSIQSSYPPGSTYKLVAAIGALQEGIITPEWSAYCPGYFQLGRKTIHCWNEKGHGEMDLLQAIKGSCNVYFYQLGLKIGLDAWTKYSRMLGFGALTNLDIPNENKGLVPSVSYFNKIFGPNKWTKGHLANLAIGQGELLTTPIQIAQFAMILANKGVYYKPHLVDHIFQFRTRKNVNFPVETKYVTGISGEVYNIVREGMRQVVDGGTGWLAKVRNIEMGGKTGTAQNPHGDSHAWFMGFAPFELPEIAIAVIVENGGGGGAVAAPLARKFLEMYFYGEVIPRPVYAAKDSSDTLDTTIDLELLIPSAIPPLIIQTREDSL